MYLGFNNSIFLSEHDSADRNDALAYLMCKNNGSARSFSLPIIRWSALPVSSGTLRSTSTTACSPGRRCRSPSGSGASGGTSTTWRTTSTALWDARTRWATRGRPHAAVLLHEYIQLLRDLIATALTKLNAGRSLLTALSHQHGVLLPQQQVRVCSIPLLPRGCRPWREEREGECLRLRHNQFIMLPHLHLFCVLNFGREEREGECLVIISL